MTDLLGTLLPQPVAVLPDNKLFTQQLQRLASVFTGASFTLTYYELFLGDQNATTGWYRRGYVIQQVRMAILPRSASWMLSGAGYYSRSDAVGLTNFVVSTGSIVKSETGRYYTIMTVQPHEWGSLTGYYLCDLKELMDLPLPYEFFGFESYQVNADLKDGEEFEDGFERGFWVDSA
jgi:hypothetical protein